MSVAFLRATLESGQSPRRLEPVTIGVPLPRSWSTGVEGLSVLAIDGSRVPTQARILNEWSDGSPRWVLLDLRVDSSIVGDCAYTLTKAEAPSGSNDGVTIALSHGSAAIETGRAHFTVGRNGDLGCASPIGAVPIVSRFRITDRKGILLPVHIERIAIEEIGCLRAVVVVEGQVAQASRGRLRLCVRYHFYQDSPTVRVQVTLLNPARAAHPGGYWDLGDRGSAFLKELSFSVNLPQTGESLEIECSPERGLPLERMAAPFELYQDSSGGENWQSSNHVNRNGRVSTTFQGYRVRAAGVEARGRRATPIVTLSNGERAVSVAHRRFWERFPKAIEVGDGELTVGLLPRQFGDVHELQGGEQITEEFVVCFGRDPVSHVPLDWVRDPLSVRVDSEWCCAAEAMPYLTPVDRTVEGAYLALQEAAIEGPDTFHLKRERIDEYGWRHFGDLYADHEAVGHAGQAPLVSHYNNQYDAISGFGRQWLRTGDLRWLELMSDLARHVIDIDVYHTGEDKSAYNRGLFWHTAHHTDAGLATHRTYPRVTGGGSGGPSAEHNYSTGLMLHYFLSGDEGARRTVLDLARWVIDMDDGRLTVFRWLSNGPTGLASATGSAIYHGPGRGSGNSITTLLNAFQLTSDAQYLEKAEALIRRCAHPRDHIAALNLLDAERRWFYTVFLQSIGRYLDVKAERGEFDWMYAYAQATLTHFARWMAQHECPYLDKPEILEFPTETWAAQDMRKSDVFFVASKHAAADKRDQFLERGEFFFQYSVRTLSGMSTRTLARPVVVMLTNGHLRHFMRTHDTRDACVAAVDFGEPAHFVPQKTIALQRLMRIVVLGGILAAAAVVALVLIS